jgi:hypothetical protein
MRQNIAFLGYTFWGIFWPARQPAKKEKKSKQLFFSMLCFEPKQRGQLILKQFAEITYQNFF